MPLPMARSRASWTGGRLRLATSSRFRPARFMRSVPVWSSPKSSSAATRRSACSTTAANARCTSTMHWPSRFAAPPDPQPRSEQLTAERTLLAHNPHFILERIVLAPGSRMVARCDTGDLAARSEWSCERRLSRIGSRRCDLCPRREGRSQRRPHRLGVPRRLHRSRRASATAVAADSTIVSRKPWHHLQFSLTQAFGSECTHEWLTQRRLHRQSSAAPLRDCDLHARSASRGCDRPPGSRHQRGCHERPWQQLQLSARRSAFKFAMMWLATIARPRAPSTAATSTSLPAARVRHFRRRGRAQHPRAAATA